MNSHQILTCSDAFVRLHAPYADIDFTEFANVIKGVKASRASFVIQRGVRKHQAKTEEREVKLAKRQQATKLSKEELEKYAPRSVETWRCICVL